MIRIVYDPPMEIAGCSLTMVSRITVTAGAHIGACIFTGAKEPIAIICKTDEGEETLIVDDSAKTAFPSPPQKSPQTAPSAPLDK